MPLVFVFTLLLSLNITIISAATDIITVGQALGIKDKLVCTNGRYALGFFESGSLTKSSETFVRNNSQNTTKWYLGIWFNEVPKFTPAWVANRDSPIKNPTSLELTISSNGNLVILVGSKKSIAWSTQANITTNRTTAMLLDSGNLILHSSSNSSNVLWQSFDYPTDTLFPGAKLGWDKVTGLNRRLVSWKNSADPATGLFCQELDPSGVNQTLITRLNSSIPYWSSGAWNGRYIPSLPETLIHANLFTFVDNDREKYFTFTMPDEYKDVVLRQVLDISGQMSTFVWIKGSLDWTSSFTNPRAQCDVDAICGPYTICNDNAITSCSCMIGFTMTSPEDWELNDRTSGCLRNTPLDCTSNINITSTTDKFYSISCVSLPQNPINVEAARSTGECTQFCLHNCSCTAYFYDDGGCSLWHNELVNIRQQQCGGPTANGKTLYLRLAAKDVPSMKRNRRGMDIGVAIGTCIVALGLLALALLLINWRNKRKRSDHILSNDQNCNTIVAFRYTDLQRATKNFSEKLGGGAFGSVFKGCLSGSVAIAVKRLDHARQGEKQFRAEVSSIGIIQHTNLVKLINWFLL